MTLTEFTWMAVTLLFSGAALLSLVRIVRGPTILDRMIAADVLLATVLLILGADMVLNDHPHNIAIMVALSATAVLATIIVARFVRRRQVLHAPTSSQGGRRD